VLTQEGEGRRIRRAVARMRDPESPHLVLDCKVLCEVTHAGGAGAACIRRGGERRTKSKGGGREGWGASQPWRSASVPAWNLHSLVSATSHDMVFSPSGRSQPWLRPEEGLYPPSRMREVRIESECARGDTAHPLKLIFGGNPLGDGTVDHGNSILNPIHSMPA
jgi:hypothetical protein